jgi:LAO/AO transport system kinase
MFTAILKNALDGDNKSIARCISLIENEVEGYEAILESLVIKNTPVIGITGPPGAGKSTITDQLIHLLVDANKSVAVLCIDPSSPFHHGALLGDRIRMSRWFNKPNVFIRSLASKGALGGLSPKVIEVTDFLKATTFDFIIIETIGVGQNEIEIASLADVTVVVLVPEAGDEIQTMKAGLMEVADIFVVNKCDRAGADTFVKYLRNMLASASTIKTEATPVLKTIASKNEGIENLYYAVEENILQQNDKKNKAELYSKKAFALITKKRMNDIDVAELKLEILKQINEGEFNIYKYLKSIK